MQISLVAAALVYLASSVSAQSGAWGQCGGIGWSGATTCVSGYTCTYSNPYYSQCLPGSASSTSTTTKSTTSTTSTKTSTTTTSTTTSTSKSTSTSTSTSSTSTSTSTTTSTSTSTGAAPTGSQIRADQDPVYHLYLQNVGGTPVLGSETTSGLFTLGSTITLNQAGGSKLYFNVNTNVTTSYKPVTFDTTAKTTTWGLSGDTIIYGNQQNFLVCPITGSANWNLYLQTGNDVPSGVACTDYITIHLPCLC
ncbi:hypothetical protein SISNIDRAFT_456850 [Sistotremastrum niveocremeum HHB9708]|uniref:CBM1 domain-containing protein n=2 Tax=Sistotremastraceae TaxID=3402574 RepID=A0A164S8Q9_9AGAM|nr:hypothetical protein SISNIDRAFT_456850 [Sistotremastrum niveocremeum HHB9708]KZT34480.1 hypothetical protein SISSUDRAFT_1052718 [Sistotremastrum suecicum HHB10207 ss-3]